MMKSADQYAEMIKRGDVDAVRRDLSGASPSELELLSDDANDVIEMSRPITPYDDLVTLIEEAQNGTPPHLSPVGKTSAETAAIWRHYSEGRERV